MYSYGQLHDISTAMHTSWHTQQELQFSTLKNGVTMVASKHISFFEQPEGLTECLCLPKSPLGSCAPPCLVEESMG